MGESGEGHYQSQEFPLTLLERQQGVASVLISDGLQYHPHDVTYYFCIKVCMTMFHNIFISNGVGAIARVVGSIPRPSCENSSDQELDLGMTYLWQPLCLPNVNVLQTLDISNLNLINI